MPKQFAVFNILKHLYNLIIAEKLILRLQTLKEGFKTYNKLQKPNFITEVKLISGVIRKLMLLFLALTVLASFSSGVYLNLQEEDGDLNEWYIANNGEGTYFLEGSKVHKGDYSLKMDDSGGIGGDEHIRTNLSNQSPENVTFYTSTRGAINHIFYLSSSNTTTQDKNSKSVLRADLDRYVPQDSN